MTRLRPAVFLDRDGTLVQERDYLAEADRVELVSGAADALRALRSAGFALVIVTNQSGIARGMYSGEDYAAVTARLHEMLRRAGARLDLTLHCAHHPDHTGPCSCRKPQTGMHMRAAEALGLDLAGSYYVGDKISDVLPALELGGHGILVRTGYGRENEGSVPVGVAVVDDLPGAARLILDARAPR